MPGFIPGSRGSFMLDLVAVAMILLLPGIAVSIQFAKRHSYASHKKAMLILSSVLLVAVIAFEVEMRLIGWTHLAEQSPYFDTLVPAVLGVHIFFSVTTAVSLFTTVALAVKRFSHPPAPNPHSQLHRRLGKLSALGLAATSVTGWVFYWLAFIATV